MKPLACDALTTTHPTRAEKALSWIPILGWTLASALEQRRFRPIVQDIERQLLDRPDTSGLWGPDPRRQKASAALRRLIMEELGWPNDRFIPEDPPGVVFWAHRDGLDGVTALTRLEREFGVQFPDEEWERLCRHGTLGELVDSLIKHAGT